MLLFFGVVQTLKSWTIAPRFVTVKTTVPRRTVLVESLNANSDGLPAVTVAVFPALLATGPAPAVSTAQASTARIESDIIVEARSAPGAVNILRPPSLAVPVVITQNRDPGDSDP